MLQQPEPDDFVLATGETHRVREFVEKSFRELDIIVKSVSSSILSIHGLCSLFQNHADGRALVNRKRALTRRQVKRS